MISDDDLCDDFIKFCFPCSHFACVPGHWWFLINYAPVSVLVDYFSLCI